MKPCAILCLGVAGFTQTLPGSFQVGYEDGRLYGGSFAKGTTPLFNGRVQLDDNLAKGFWLGTQLTEAWGLEASVRRGTTDLIEPAPGVWASQPKLASLDFSVLEVAVHRSYSLGRFHPYWQTGVGLATMEILTLEGANQKDRRASLGVGGGAVFWMAPWFGFRFDIRAHAIYLGSRAEGQDQGPADLGRWLRTQEVLAGIELSFGGIKASL